jgi:hypothetical protein
LFMSGPTVGPLSLTIAMTTPATSVTTRTTTTTATSSCCLHQKWIP